MGKKEKKFITQDELSKLTPDQVMSIDPARIPEGFDIIHEDGVNPKLVKAVDENEKPKPEQAVAPSVNDERDAGEGKERDNRTVDDYKGILWLRYFKKDDSNGKVLTRFKRKVYFPLNPQLESGWYIATIIEERKNHGIMDTMTLDSIEPIMWNTRYIRGIFVKRNHAANCLEIYPAIPKDQLDEQKPAVIHIVKLPEQDKKLGITIGDVLTSKMKEAMIEATK